MSESRNHLHNVLFDLNDSSPEKTEKLITDCYTHLKPHDGILFFSAGPRAADCARDVNDLKFQVALTVLFTNRAAHNAYQASETHDVVIERNKGNWARARVFNLLDEPDTALSQRNQVALLRILKEMSEAGHAQFIVATHSPVLLACPGARIPSFDSVPVTDIENMDTDYYRLYKSFLDDPGAHIAGPNAVPPVA